MKVDISRFYVWWLGFGFIYLSVYSINIYGLFNMESLLS